MTGRPLRTAAGRADSRAKLIGAVHVSARALSEDDRRAIYHEVTGKRSLTMMTPAEIGRVLDRLNAGRPRAMGHRPHVAKIRALWWTLYWLGEIDEPNDHALDAFVQRQAKVASLRFLTHHRAPAVIEALKAWAERAGVFWPTAAEVAQQTERTDASVQSGAHERGYSPAGAERLAVIDAIWTKLTARGLSTYGSPDAYISAALRLSEHNRAYWTTREMDDAIKLLGKKLRRALSRSDGGAR